MSGILTPIRILDASYTHTQGKLSSIFAEFGAEIFHLEQKATYVVTLQLANELIAPTMAEWASRVDIMLSDNQSRLSAAYEAKLLHTINPKLIYCTVLQMPDLFHIDQTTADLWQTLASDPMVKWQLARRLRLLWQQAQQTLQGCWLDISELLTQPLQEDGTALGVAQRLDVGTQMELSLPS